MFFHSLLQHFRYHFTSCGTFINADCKAVEAWVVKHLLLNCNTGSLTPSPDLSPDTYLLCFWPSNPWYHLKTACSWGRNLKFSNTGKIQEIKSCCLCNFGPLKLHEWFNSLETTNHTLGFLIQFPPKVPLKSEDSSYSTMYLNILSMPSLCNPSLI